MQVVQRHLNSTDNVTTARAFYPDLEYAEDLPPEGVLTLEDEKGLSSYPVVAFSISYEMDLVHIIEMLQWAGIQPLASDRSDEDPFILLGGPVSLSNVLPFAPFADAFVMGEAEENLSTIAGILRDHTSNKKRREKLVQVPGVYVPEHHGLETPDPLTVDASFIPAHGSFWSPHSELSNMFLVESSRGCPRYCKFCVVRSTNTPMRFRDVEHILNKIPKEAPRVGFVGAGVSEYPQIKEALKFCVDQGQEIGLSSLRADQLDDEFVELLARGGVRTMTVASDAPSEVQRSKMAKALKERHLIQAAELARKHGLHRLKVYVIIGLPGETEEDLDELVRFAHDMSRIHKVTIAVNPLVPKLRTPLARAEFGPMKELNSKIRYLKTKAKGRVDLRTLSPRWAWVEMMLSQGGPETGLAVLDVARSDGSFATWKRALSRIERPFHARELAEENNLSAVLPRR
jgi:radical SAM superfamily enzyme YgiQ (UPF0313 family)